MARSLVFEPDIFELAEFFDRCRVKRRGVTYESVAAISNAETARPSWARCLERRARPRV
jgi:hypothetical protein